MYLDDGLRSESCLWTTVTARVEQAAISADHRCGDGGGGIGGMYLRVHRFVRWGFD